MKIVQISDLHLCKNENKRIFGLVNTDSTFIDVLNTIKTEKPDFVIATGDLSQDGSIESYQRLKNYLSTLDCEIFTLFGNHDSPDNMLSNLVGNNIIYTPTFESEFGTFIFCNSYKKGFDYGILGTHGLVNLEQNLMKFENCIIVVHHHFIKLNTFVDKYILEDTLELQALLVKYKNKIKLCITGHVHNSFNINYEGIKIHNSLSTCIQFAKTKKLLFDNKGPGYTVYNFENDSFKIEEKIIK